MLEDVIRLFQARAEVYHNAKLCGNWVVQESELGQTCFHMPTEGNGILEIPGHPPQLMQTGDMVVFPREIPHQIHPTEPSKGEQKHLPFFADNEPGVGMMCARIQFYHRGFGTLLDSLPSYIVIRRKNANAWLEPLLKMIIQESYRESAHTHLILDRLAELLFIMAIRQYAENIQPNNKGLITLFADTKIKNAIKRIHETPGEDWTLEKLASVCGMSRTSFANSFRQLSGWTPMQYVTWWRMQIAWQEVTSGQPSNIVAEKVGYQSEAAFSRAFKKEFGINVRLAKQNIK